jgi:hypothetical protein
MRNIGVHNSITNSYWAKAESRKCAFCKPLFYCLNFCYLVCLKEGGVGARGRNESNDVCTCE